MLGCTYMCTKGLENSDYKMLRNQIIKGFRDIDTVEGLLKEKEITLAATIMHCHCHKAAKKQCSDITEVDQGIIMAACLQYQTRSKTCTGHGTKRPSTTPSLQPTLQ